MAQQNSSGKVNMKAWLVLAAACLVMFTPTYAQMQMSPLAGQLMETYSITEAQYMSVYSAPQIMPAILSFVAGILLDKFGTKKCVLVASSLAMIGIVARVFVAGYVPLYCVTMMFGFTTSFIVTGSTKVVARFFPPEKVGTAVGILYSFATIAGLVAMATTAYFPTTKSAFIVSAIVAVAAVLAWAFLVPSETPEELSAGTSGEKVKIGEVLKSVLTCRDIYFIVIAAMFVGVIGFTLGGILPTVLGSRGMSAAEAGLMGSVYSIGQLVGCLAMSPILAKVKSEKAFLCGMAAVLIVLFPLVMIVPLGPVLGVLLFAIGFLSYGLTPVFLALPIRYEKIGPARAGTAGGLLTTIQSLGSAFLPGVLTSIAGGNYATLFAIMAGMAAMILVCALFTRFPKAEAAA